jgi:hypothetical protein
MVQDHSNGMLGEVIMLKVFRRIKVKHRGHRIIVSPSQVSLLYHEAAHAHLSHSSSEKDVSSLSNI